MLASTAHRSRSRSAQREIADLLPGGTALVPNLSFSGIGAARTLSLSLSQDRMDELDHQPAAGGGLLTSKGKGGEGVGASPY